MADAKGNSNNIGPNGKVTFNGDSNITVAESGADDDGKVTVALNKNLEVDSVTTGNTVMNNGGLAVDDGAGNKTVVSTGGTTVADAAGGSATYDATGTTITDGTRTTTVGAGVVSVAGANTVTIDGDAGTIDGLANKTFDPDHYTSGQAATEDQLKQVSDVANTGWNVSANGGTAAQVKPGDNVDFSNTDGNITVARTDNGSDHDLTFDLADDITVDSVTAGNSTLNTNGLTIDDGAGNSTTITTAGTVVADGTNTTTYGADGLAIAGGPTISSAGIDAAGTKVTGVADGTIGAGSSDAINGSQLQAAGASLAGDVLGGNAKYDGATNSYTMTDIGGTGEDTINDAIASANDAANAGWNLTAQGANGTNVGPNDAVDLNNSDGNIEVSKTGTSNDVTFDLADDITVASVTAGNSVLDTNGLTVDDGAGHVTSVTTGGTQVTDGTNTTSYGADGMAITGGPVISSAGIDAAGTKVTGVADGTIGAGSSDAINGSQLQAAGASLAGDVLGGNAKYDGATNSYTMSDIGGTGEDTINDAIASANTAANAGWNVADAKGNSNNIGPNGKVTFNGDSNITVAESGADDDGKVTVALNKNLEVDSVTTGNTVMDDNGLTIDDGAGNSTTITTAGTVVADGTNTTTYGADGLAIAGGPTISSAGIDAAGKKITNVTAGDVSAGSTDAVNGSQLNATNTVVENLGDSAVTVLGGNASYDDSTGTLTMSNIGGTGEDNINDAIASANNAANAGWNVADAKGNSNNIGPNGKVTFNGDSNITVTESGADDDGKVTVALNKNLEVDSMTAGDSTLDSNGLVVNDGTSSTSYGADGMAIVGGPVITGAGIDAAGTKITHVANGVADSDAVNMGQLNTATDGLTTAGMNFTGNDNSAGDVHRDLGQTLAIKGEATTAGTYGGGNIKTVTDPNTGTVQIQIANSPKFGNITINVDGSGRITGVAKGIDGTDAVNKDQLDAVGKIASAGWNVTAQGQNKTNVAPDDTVDLNNSDGNIVVGKTAHSNDVTFDLANDIKVDSVSLGSDVKLDTTGLLIVGGPSITVNGIDAGNLKITNVAPGAAPTDAVNMSQLDAVSDSVTQLADNAVQYDNADKDQVTLGGTTSTDGGKTGGTRISNVHRGDVSANSTDAVNGSQLYETNQKVANNSDAINDLQTGQGGYFQVNDTSGKGKPKATGKDATAGGAGAVASADHSTAVGSGAQATGGNSVALGAGSVAKRDDVVSVGSGAETRQITHVAAGTEETDAVNVGQLDSAVAGAKNWAKTYTDKRLDLVDRNMNVLGHRVDAGVASAMAMASLPQVYDADQSSAAVALGQFHGETGLAVGLSTVSESGHYVFKLNATTNTRGDTGVGVGAAVVW